MWVSENDTTTTMHSGAKICSRGDFLCTTRVHSLYIDTIQRNQIEGRYPDNKKLIYSYNTRDYTYNLFVERKNF